MRLCEQCGGVGLSVVGTDTVVTCPRCAGNRLERSAVALTLDQVKASGLLLAVMEATGAR